MHTVTASAHSYTVRNVHFRYVHICCTCYMDYLYVGQINKTWINILYVTFPTIHTPSLYRYIPFRIMLRWDQPINRRQEPAFIISTSCSSLFPTSSHSTFTNSSFSHSLRTQVTGRRIELSCLSVAAEGGSCSPCVSCSPLLRHRWGAFGTSPSKKEPESQLLLPCDVSTRKTNPQSIT